MSNLTQRLGGAKSSLAFKAPCRVASTGNLVLSGFQTVDGVLPTSSAHVDLRRILVKNQTAGAENGIYTMDTGAWVRTRDFDSVNDIREGTRMYVFSGSTTAGAYVVTSDVDPDAFVIDTTSITIAAASSVDSSISALTELTTPDPAADFLQIVDTSSGESKKVKPASLFKYHGDGTAALPAIAFESDLTKGIYSAGSNLLGFSIAGAGELILSGSALYPLTSDGLALGIATTNLFSDAFFASGAVLDFNGDIVFTHSADTFTMTGGTFVLPASGLQVGSSNPFSDSAGTLTLQNIDALDATTEATIEAAIDTLANLTSVQGQTFTLAGAFITSGANSLTLTTTGATNVTLPTTGTLATLAGTEALTNKTIDLTSNTLTGSVAEFNTALESADFYTTGGTDVAMADGGTGASLTDPNADRIMFWDDSAGAVDWLAMPAAGITISTTSIALANDLAALEGLGSTGIAVRSGSDTWVQRSIAGTANEITATNGDGVSADPTLSLPTALTFTGKTVTGGTFAGPATTGTADVQEAFKLSGDISPTALSGHVDDYSPTGLSTATIIRQDGGAASRNITGLAGGSDGLVKVIINIGASDNLVLKNETTSTAANQFKFGADITLTPSQGAILCYDSTSSRWRAIGVFTTAGGGGGTVTSVSAGYGMNFNAITASGAAALNAAHSALVCPTSGAL